MKKTILFVLLVFITSSIALTSCKKSNNLQYSCNPEINQWAIDNARTLEVSTRNEVAQYLTIDSQFAAYRILTPTNKCNVWKEKLMIVYNTFSLSTEEKNHIMAAYNYLTPTMFESEENISTLKTWADNWKADGIAEFEWSEEECNLIAGTWLTPTEINDYKNYRLSNSSGGGMSIGASGPVANPGAADCECYYSVSCSMRGDGVCVDGSCTGKTGCGVFGTTNCSGRCQ